MKPHILSIIKSIIVSGIIFNSSCYKKPESEKLSIIEKAADFELINQNGEKISSALFSDKVKVMSFIFTRCMMPKMCPRTVKNFCELQELAGDELSGKMEMFLVSFDPENDTPGVLKKYGELYGVDFSNCHLLTGEKETIEKVCNDYEIIAEKQEYGDYRHSLITFLIDRNNNVRKLYFANQWKPEEIKRDMLSLLENRNEE